jgi:hypothetical protein
MGDPLRGDSLRPAWLLYIASTPAVRLWTGVANFKVGPGAGPDATGGIYYGLGIVAAVPALPIAMNGEFASIELRLSGITAAIAKLMNVEAPMVRQARLHIASLELDDCGSPIGAPAWVIHAFVNTPRLTRDGGSSPPTLTLSLVCSTGSPKRTVKNGGYWTGPQQRTIDPTDSSADRVSQYATGTNEIWPT